MIEEIDELEEDVIWSISYLEDVMDTYVHELEGVLDNSGIAIDTKFSALYLPRYFDRPLIRPSLSCMCLFYIKEVCTRAG